MDENSQLAIKVSPSYFRTLTRDKSEDFFSGRIGKLKNDLFDILGVSFPALQILFDEEMSGEQFSIQVGKSFEIIAGLKANQLLTKSTREKLDEIKVSAEKDHYLRDGDYFITQVTQKNTLNAAGQDSWDGFEYILLNLGEQMKKHCTTFITSEKIQADLEKIRESFPQLVETIYDQHLVEKTTELLRALVSEGISVRNLKDILQSVLDSDFIKVDGGKNIILDERVAMYHRPWTGSVNDLLKFTRNSLRSQVSYQFAPTGTMNVMLLDPEIETLLCTSYAETIDVEIVEKIIEETRLGFEDWPKGSDPIVLTTDETRPLFHDLVKESFPNLIVLAYTELESYLSITTLSRISIKR